MPHIQKIPAGPRIVLLQVILLLTTLLLLFGCGKEKEEKKLEVVRPVKTMTVEAGENSSNHRFPGTVRASRRAELSFKVSGPLVELPVEEGQHVQQGDLIAQIQKRDFLNAVEEARATSLQAEKQFSRYKELYARKQVSRADYDRYRASRDVARAQLEDARNRLADTSLRAPFAGIISKRFVENFQKVQAKEPIVNLQDITRLEILVNVPELLMAELRKEKPVKVTASFESIPGREYDLEVKEYSTQADPTTQTYQVVLTMEQPEEANILPGMTATVTAVSRRNTDSGSRPIIIPAIAVLDASGNQPYVWLLDSEDSTAHKHPITIGSLAGSENIVVKEGLKGGEIIIISGMTQLEEGMKVRPWEKQREGK